MASISAHRSRNFPRRRRTCCSMAKPGKRRKTGFNGILGYLKQNLEESTSESYRDWLLDYMSATECPACHGKRLRPESLAVKVNGMSIADFTALPVSRSVEVAQKIKLAGREADDRRTHHARNRGAAAVSERRGAWVYLARPLGGDACRAARASASDWRRRSGRSCAAFCMCSTSLRSDCIIATTIGC